MRLRKQANERSSTITFWDTLSCIQKRSILIAGSLSFLVLFDIYGSAVILVDLAPLFEVEIAVIQRIQSLFFLGLTLLVPVAGWAASRESVRRLTAAATAMFAVSGAIIALLPTLEIYLIGRFLQGTAAGLILPLALSIINGAFEPGKKGRAIGLWGSTALMAPLLAPPLAGWLSDWAGPLWHFGLVASGAAAISALCLLMLPATSPPPEEKNKSFDWKGYTLIGGALCCLLAATAPTLGEPSIGWILGCGTGALLLLGGYLRYAQSAPHPLIALELFRYRDFTVGLGATLGRSFLVVSSTLAIPVFLNKTLSLGTGTIGALLFAPALLLALLTPAIGMLIDRGRPLALAAVGFAVFGIASGGFMLLPHWPLLGLAGTLLLVRALGMAFILGPTVAGTLGALPASYNYAASSTFNLAQRIGGTLGAASVPLFLEWREAHGLIALFALGAGIAGAGAFGLCWRLAAGSPARSSP
jgi:MFS family permease